MNLKETHNFARKNKIEFLDLKFTDLPGTWQHFTVPINALNEGAITEGIGFDGSSIRGFQDINESDMVLMPDLSTVVIDPFSDNTLSIIANIRDPVKKVPYTRDPRFVAIKALEHLRKSKIGDMAFFGPEAEFFILDDVKFGQNENSGYYFIDSKEGVWNSGSDEEPNLGHKPRHKEGYFPVPPVDSYQNLRNKMVSTMQKCGIEIEAHHHEVGTAGQAEIDMKYSSIVRSPDNLMMYKYIVKNTALQHNKTVTFMPKPIFSDNGSGMHCHQSIWKNGKNLFAGDGYAGLSQLGLHYIGGILKHAPALTAFCSPTTNSFKRLVPGFEAPVNLVYSKRNRSAAVRIPVYSDNPNSKRIEYRSPDPSCNPYLAFSAMLMAGLDGIKNKIDPGDPTDVNLYDLSEEEASGIESLPKTLGAALDALEHDHDFLLEGDVFTHDLVHMWVEYKRGEVDALRLRPHPWEFHMYYDI